MTVEQSDREMNQERPLTAYIEKNVGKFDKDRCIDGRQAPESTQGYQMPGGDMHIITLRSLAHNTPINTAAISEVLQILKSYEVSIGFHRGSNKKPEAGICDCGFCDKLQLIIQNALS